MRVGLFYFIYIARVYERLNSKILYNAIYLMYNVCIYIYWVYTRSFRCKMANKFYLMYILIVHKNILCFLLTLGLHRLRIIINIASHPLPRHRILQGHKPARFDGHARFGLTATAPRGRLRKMSCRYILRQFYCVLWFTIH